MLEQQQQKQSNRNNNSLNQNNKTQTSWQVVQGVLGTHQQKNKTTPVSLTLRKRWITLRWIKDFNFRTKTKTARRKLFKGWARARDFWKVPTGSRTFTKL